MRIISGKARGTKLFTLDGLNTRPTLDRVKEPLFSIIQEYVLDSDVLDLFAGSGALTGIENDFEQTVDGVIKTVRENRRELE